MKDGKALREASGLFYLKVKVIFDKIELKDKLDFFEGGVAVWQFTFDELADYLMQGREIESRYEGKDYSITNSHHEWHFCCDSDETNITLCAFPEFNILVDQVRSIEIGEISIERIFNEHLGGLDVLAVL